MVMLLLGFGKLDMGCKGTMKCNCPNCTKLPDVDRTALRNGPFSGNNPKPTKEQVDKVAAEAKKILKDYPPEKEKELLQLQIKELGEVRYDFKTKEDRAKLAYLIAKKRILGINDSKNMPKTIWSNKSVATIATLLNAVQGTTADTRRVMDSVIDATAKKGEFFLDKTKLGKTTNAFSNAEVLRSAMNTHENRQNTCDAYSVYNPAQTVLAPADVNAKRLACGSNTDGACVPKDGGKLYPFACVPTFEACMAGDAEACSVISQQYQAGSIEELRKDNNSFPKVTIKPGSTAEKLLEAWNDVWGHKSLYSKPENKHAYDMLLVGLLMDKVGFDKLKAEPGESFDLRHQKLSDRVWLAVQVPIIKMINRARVDPMSYDKTIRTFLPHGKYETYADLKPVTLEAKMIQLRDSTDMMKLWLEHVKYTSGDDVKLDQFKAAVFLMGVDLIRQALGISKDDMTEITRDMRNIRIDINAL
jgi:hypothetical protein